MNVRNEATLMIWLDCIALHVATLCARRLAWSPIGARVFLKIDESRDPGLRSRTLGGVICATSPDADSVVSKAIIDLDSSLLYFGHYRRNGITAVRVTPARRWHGLNRLLVAPVAVRIIDCDAEDGDAQDRDIALATMRLGGRRHR